MIRVALACCWMVFSVYYSWCLRPVEKIPYPPYYATVVPDQLAVPGDDDSAMIQRAIDSGAHVIRFLPRVYVLDRQIELPDRNRNGGMGQTITGLQWTPKNAERFR
jgi:hypothetical protein